MNISKPKALLVAMTMAISSMQMAKADSFDSSTGVLKLNYVKVGSLNYKIELQLDENGNLVLLSAVPATDTKGIANKFDANTGILVTPIIDIDGVKYKGEFELDDSQSAFTLLSAATGTDSDDDA